MKAGCIPRPPQVLRIDSLSDRRGRAFNQAKPTHTFYEIQLTRTCPPPQEKSTHQQTHPAAGFPGFGPGEGQSANPSFQMFPARFPPGGSTPGLNESVVLHHEVDLRPGGQEPPGGVRHAPLHRQPQRPVEHEAHAHVGLPGAVEHVAEPHPAEVPRNAPDADQQVGRCGGRRDGGQAGGEVASLRLGPGSCRASWSAVPVSREKKKCQMPKSAKKETGKKIVLLNYFFY